MPLPRIAPCTALHRTRILSLSVGLALLTHAPLVGQDIPPGYYDTVDDSNATTLRTTLHAVIDDHIRFPYTSGATDTWDILEAADEDPNNSANVLDLYRNASYPKQGGGNPFYDREHTWPNSYGFPDDGAGNYPFSDCHQLFLCDGSYNGSRSNKPYRYCSASCSEKVTDVNNGTGGGSGTYPGFSNWTAGQFTSGTWEAWIGRRGDVARALMYLDVRYEGGTHGNTGHSEPDLILTDNEALIAASNTGSNESVAYMGMLSVLVQWHQEDPVDSLEIQRNDEIYLHQGNRNPFIDHPEWVACLYSGACGGGGTPPQPPTGVSATAGDGQVDLSWSPNAEPDIAGYHVYRSTSSGGPYSGLNVSLIPGTAYTDTTAANGVTYYYVVTAEDLEFDESAFSAEVSATPTGPGGSGLPWINEFHYDNTGADTGEFIEVAGPAGLDLTGYSLVGYNGNGGAVYKTVALSGVIPDQQGCQGTLSFAFVGLQNGAPDGMALVAPGDVVLEFLSYEGSFTAVGGPAGGMASTNVIVTESSSTPVGHSLQRGGTGSQATDFTWQSAMAETPGSPNTGQTFSGGCPPAAPTGLAAFPSDSQVALDWDDNAEPDLDGYRVHRAEVSGGPYVTLNGTLQPTSDYTDLTALNGTTYYYVVTAVNTGGNEGIASDEVSATPTDGTAPAAPASLVAVAGDTMVQLDWDDNVEADLQGYHVYRALVPGGPYSPVTGTPIANSQFCDAGLTNGVTYFYVVTAVDTSDNESGNSNEAMATPMDPTPDPWINELHYDDKRRGGDFIELAGVAGVDLSGFEVVAYDASTGRPYRTDPLNGVIADQQNGFGTLAFFVQGLRNDAGDAIALIDSTGEVLEFLSYEGNMTALRGPAKGWTSVDVGVSESVHTDPGHSLQLTGSGDEPGDFTWQPPQARTPGQPNTGQTFE